MARIVGSRKERERERVRKGMECAPNDTPRLEGGLPKIHGMFFGLIVHVQVTFTNVDSAEQETLKQTADMRANFE